MPIPLADAIAKSWVDLRTNATTPLSLGGSRASVVELGTTVTFSPAQPVQLSPTPQVTTSSAPSQPTSVQLASDAAVKSPSHAIAQPLPKASSSPSVPLTSTPVLVAKGAQVDEALPTLAGTGTGPASAVRLGHGHHSYA